MQEYARRAGTLGKATERIKSLYSNIENADLDAELTAELVGEYIFTDEAFVRNLSTEHRNVFQKIYDEINYLAKVVTAGSKEARQLEKVKHIFDKMYRESEVQKNTVEDGEVKYSLSVKEVNGTEHIVNPYNITKDDVLDFLEKSNRRRFEDDSYFPVSSYTPEAIINTVKNAGVDISNKPLAMQVKKAKQAQQEGKPYIAKDGTRIRFHAMKPEEILEVIDKLNSPEIAIQQTNRTKTIKTKDGEIKIIPAPDNFVFFVTISSGKECVAVIEFDSSINENYIVKDGKGEEYHTTVTVFEPDVMRDGMPFDYAEYLLSKDTNNEVEIKNGSSNLETAYGENLATDSKKELPANSISQPPPNVNTPKSLSPLGDDFPIRPDLRGTPASELRYEPAPVNESDGAATLGAPPTSSNLLTSKK